MITWMIGIAAAAIICLIHYLINERQLEKEPVEHSKPFIVSEHHAHMEQVIIDILEHREPIDQTIILWWGLDGLRLNEDGTSKLVNRRKGDPVPENVSYQSFRSIQPIQTGHLLSDQTQCTRVQIDALMAQNTMLQIQAANALQNRQIIDALQVCCVQTKGYYAPYCHTGCIGFDKR